MAASLLCVYAEALKARHVGSSNEAASKSFLGDVCVNRNRNGDVLINAHLFRAHEIRAEFDNMVCVCDFEHAFQRFSRRIYGTKVLETFPILSFIDNLTHYFEDDRTLAIAG